MKRGTKLLILTGVLAVVLGAFFLLIKLLPDDTANPSSSETKVVFTLDPAKVTKFGWKFTTEANFTKTENGWVNDADSTFPVDSAVLEKMFTGLVDVTASKTIENPGAPEQYGLKDPYCSIKVTADGKDYNLAIGDQNSFNGLVYFSNGDGKVYMVSSAIVDYFNFGPEEVLLLDTIPNLNSLIGLKVEHGEKTYEITKQVDSGKAYSNYYEWFWNDAVTLDTELTEEMLKVVYDLAWKGCANHNATEFAEYGLDNPTVITVTYQKDKTFVLHVGTKTDKGYYARIADSNMVCYVGYGIAETLRNLGADELKPDEALKMVWDDVISAEIILKGNTYSLTTEEEGDSSGCATGSYIWKYGDEQVKAGDVFTKLEALGFTGYATGQPTEEQTEEIRFVFHTKTTGFETVELVIYSYTSTECWVTLNGESTVKVQRSDVTKLVGETEKLFPAA